LGHRLEIKITQKIRFPEVDVGNGGYPRFEHLLSEFLNVKYWPLVARQKSTGKFVRYFSR
jgi:hypothetical protein